jgi:ATP adenylyltransferase
MDRLWTPWRSAYVGGEPKDGCPFCERPAAGDDVANLILLRAARCFVIMNLYPYNTGHLMIVPYRHVAAPGDLSPEEWHEMVDLLPRLTGALGAAMRPDGFNIGMNVGSAAGAGIADHIHLHIVPRWVGDTSFMPVLGATKVLPELLPDTYARLRQALERPAAEPAAPPAAEEASAEQEPVAATEQEAAAPPPVPQAGAVVLVRDKVALRLTRDGAWVLPKGHIEPGETPEQAAEREVAEEMGLSGRLGPAVGELRFAQGQRERQVTYYLFHAGRPLPSWEEHLGRDAFLFSPREAVERLTHPDARALLARALEQARGGDDR